MASRAAAHLVNVGHGNVVVASLIVAIVALDSLPVKRLIESAKGSMKRRWPSASPPSAAPRILRRR